MLDRQRLSTQRDESRRSSHRSSQDSGRRSLRLSELAGFNSTKQTETVVAQLGRPSEGEVRLKAEESKEEEENRHTLGGEIGESVKHTENSDDLAAGEAREKPNSPVQAEHIDALNSATRRKPRSQRRFCQNAETDLDAYRTANQSQLLQYKETARVQNEAIAKSKAEEKARNEAEIEAKLKVEAEEEEARSQAELQRKRKAEEARIQAELETKLKVETEEEARSQAELETKRKAEEVRIQAELETKLKVETEEEAPSQAELETKRKGEEVRIQAAQEVRLKAEEDASTRSLLEESATSESVAQEALQTGDESASTGQTSRKLRGAAHIAGRMKQRSSRPSSQHAFNKVDIEGVVLARRAARKAQEEPSQAKIKEQLGVAKAQEELGQAKVKEKPSIAKAPEEAGQTKVKEKTRIAKAKEQSNKVPNALSGNADETQGTFSWFGINDLSDLIGIGANAPPSREYEEYVEDAPPESPWFSNLGRKLSGFAGVAAHAQADQAGPSVAVDWQDERDRMLGQMTRQEKKAAAETVQKIEQNVRDHVREELKAYEQKVVIEHEEEMVQMSQKEYELELQMRDAELVMYSTAVFDRERLLRDNRRVRRHTWKAKLFAIEERDASQRRLESARNLMARHHALRSNDFGLHQAKLARSVQAAQDAHDTERWRLREILLRTRQEVITPSEADAAEAAWERALWSLQHEFEAALRNIAECKFIDMEVLMEQSSTKRHSMAPQLSPPAMSLEASTTVFDAGESEVGGVPSTPGFGSTLAPDKPFYQRKEVLAQAYLKSLEAQVLPNTLSARTPFGLAYARTP